MGVLVACEHMCPPFSLHEWLLTDGERIPGPASTLLFLAASRHSLQHNNPTNIPDDLKVLQEKGVCHRALQLNTQTRILFVWVKGCDLFTLNAYFS